jgi:Spy/CpxP family protein refolding chaperone
MTFAQFPPGRLFRLAAVSLAIGVSSITFAEPPPPADAPPPREARPGEPRPGGENRPRPMMEVFEQYGQLIQDLNLDSDQAKRIRESMRTARESLQAMGRDAQTMSPQDRLAAFNEVLDTMNADISTTLNEEQKKTFDTRTAEIRTKAEATMRRPRPDGANGPNGQPTTRPGQGAGGPGGQGGGPAGMAGRFAERIDRALDAAEATDEQREKLKPILEEAREKIAKVIAEAQANGAADPQAIRGQMREVMEAVREKAAGILSPEQAEKFRAAMQPPNRGGGGGQGGGPGGGRGGQRDGQGGGGGMNGDPPPPPPPGDKPQANNSKPSPEAGTAGLAASASTPASPTTRPVAIGEPMPAFELSRLNGNEITNKSLAGKPAVIIFGSLSAPSFRDRAPMLGQLAKKYGSRTRFLIVYTREQHPIGSDEPERNRDDKITIAAHTTAKERAAAAKAARDQLDLTVDMAIDSMDDTLTRQLDGFPNGAAVFDADGKLADHQKWVEPFALERTLDRILQRK